MDANKAGFAEGLLKEALQRRAAGDRAGALATLEAATALEPDHLGLQVERACELRILHRLDEAETALDAVLASASDHAAALVERAHVRRSRGDRDGSLAGFLAASRVAPDRIPIRLEIVRDLRALRRFDEAEAELKTVVAIDRRNIGAAIERGHIARQRGDHAKAAAAFAAALAAEPTNGDVKVELARELTALGCLDDAELTLGAALAADPTKAHLHLERAQLARKRGDHAVALQALEDAAAATPTEAAAELRLQIAAELRRQGRCEAALQQAQAALAARGDEAAAAMELGQIHRALGDADMALAAFERAARNEARRAEALVEVARECWRLGRPREAAAALAAALACEPDRLGALLLAAEHAYAAGRGEEALDAARRAVAHHPDAPAAYLVGARVSAEHAPADSLSLLAQAETAFAGSAEIAATRIHVLRLQRDNGAAGEIIAAAAPMISSHAGLWAEAVSYATANGDFAAARRWLDARPDDLPRTRARERALRGEMAQALRDHEAASDHYREAIAEGGEQAEWLERLAECRLLLADVDGARAALVASIKADAARRKARGLSLNYSQHHLAQVMEEFLLDPESLEEMQRIVKLPASEQIAPLRALVRRAPDNTGPALLLLNAMRRAGLFNGALFVDNGRASQPGPIPRRIVQYWHQKELPRDVAGLMKTWRDANPDCEHIVLNDASAEERLKSCGVDEAFRAFRNANEIPQKADILRWAVLAFDGGLFVDADDRCLTPLAAYVPFEANFLAYQDRIGSLGSNFIGAAKNHPVILRTLRQACAAVNRGDRDVAWLSTGGGLLLRTFVQEAIGDTADWLQNTTIAELFLVTCRVGVHCALSKHHEPR